MKREVRGGRAPICRAGTMSAFNDGGAAANNNAWLDALGRYKFDDGYINGVTVPAAGCSPANGTAVVGSHAPNAGGRYDTHGNVWERCLDWHGSTLDTRSLSAVADETDQSLDTRSFTVDWSESRRLNTKRIIGTMLLLR